MSTGAEPLLALRNVYSHEKSPVEIKGECDLSLPVYSTCNRAGLEDSLTPKGKPPTRRVLSCHIGSPKGFRDMRQSCLVPERADFGQR